MPHTRRRRGTTRPPRALKRRAPRKKRRRGPAPAPFVLTRASAAGRVVGSQSDWQNSPRQNFFAGVKRGLFRRLAAPRRPLIGRPDSNGLNQARNYVASLRSPGGRAGARSKACHTESLSSVRKHKLLCARETGQETQSEAPLAVASPRPIDKRAKKLRSRHGFARARRLTANQQQHQSPWRTRSPPDPPKLL